MSNYLNNIQRRADMFKALSNPHRLALFQSFPQLTDTAACRVLRRTGRTRRAAGAKPLEQGQAVRVGERLEHVGMALKGI